MEGGQTGIFPRKDLEEWVRFLEAARVKVARPTPLMIARALYSLARQVPFPPAQSEPNGTPLENMDIGESGIQPHDIERYTSPGLQGTSPVNGNGTVPSQGTTVPLLTPGRVPLEGPIGPRFPATITVPALPELVPEDQRAKIAKNRYWCPACSKHHDPYPGMRCPWCVYCGEYHVPTDRCGELSLERLSDGP